MRGIPEACLRPITDVMSRVDVTLFEGLQPYPFQMIGCAVAGGHGRRGAAEQEGAQMILGASPTWLEAAPTLTHFWR